ncbi:MAG: metallophosphoesterase [Lachnospiraceae bacterium]|nr:metallophosphoesterase [Lachnospiraceae bacterium]
MYWMFFISAMLVAVIAGIVYMTVAVGRFGAVKKLAGEKKLRRILVPFLLIALVFAAFSFILNPYDAVIIFLHVTVFFLLCGLITRIIRRVRKKDFQCYVQGWMALCGAAVYLCISYILCVNVWQTDYMLATDKDLGNLRVAMISDSHLGAIFDGEGFAEYMDVIREQSPDLLVIVGDFVDDGSKKADVEIACDALRGLHLPYGVFYVYGNHDKGYYNRRDFSAEELKDMLEQNGVYVLDDECVLVDDRFYIAGRRDSSMKGRKGIDTLLSGIDEDKYVIVLDHQPDDYEAEAASAADLVLSGHTHGGQLFPMNFVGQWAHVDDKIYGHERRNGKDFIVSSGIADWEIHFKSGVSSEYVIIDILQNRR